MTGVRTDLLFLSKENRGKKKVEKDFTTYQPQRKPTGRAERWARKSKAHYFISRAFTRLCFYCAILGWLRWKTEI